MTARERANALLSKACQAESLADHRERHGRSDAAGRMEAAGYRAEALAVLLMDRDTEPTKPPPKADHIERAVLGFLRAVRGES